MERTPERGDLWRHHKGNEYEVLHVTNTAVSRPNHPPDVVYWQRLNGAVYSRPLSDWHRAMTFVMDSKTRSALLAAQDKVIEQWTEHEGFVTGLVDGVATHVIGVIALDRAVNMLYAKSGDYKLGAEAHA